MPGFNDALKVILKHEGGFVNDPLDRGGATNYGITQAVYEAFVKRKVSVDEIKNMPMGNVSAIYKKEYWDKIGGDKIKYYPVAFALFDQAINRGPGTVANQVQKVLGLPQDGKIGPTTLAKLNAIPDKDFLNQFLIMSESSYKAIVDKNPTQAKFLKGWLNRVSSIKSYVSTQFGSLNAASVGVGLIALAGLSFFLYLKLKKK